MNKVIRYIFILVCIGIMAYSAWNIWSINDEYEEVDAVYEDLAEKFIVIEEANDTDPGKVNADEPTTAAPEVKISFEELVAMYPDVIGWLYCEGTPINYPVVQAKDNDYYLRRMINGKYNVGGTIFVDYRNSDDFSDPVTLIYGHNMKNGSMFGAIPKYAKKDFLQAHKIMTLKTPDKNYEIEIIGGVKTDAYDPIYSMDVGNLAKQLKYAPEKGEKIIVFSTCLYDTEDSRYLLAGTLREVVADEN
ncbi:MAG: class B sortase [Clostridia bacterium]|nr:class B sortase [Clostridia bacterium]